MRLRTGFCAATLALCAISVFPASAQRSNSGRSSSSSSSSNNNNANSPVAQASKAVAKARSEVTQAQADVNRIKAKTRSQLLTKPEWASVVAAQKKAELNMEQAKRAALNALRNKPEYKQLSEERDAAQKQMADSESGSNKLSDEELQKASGTVFKDGLAMKKMESAALKDDAKYAAAKEEYDAATAKLADLDPQVEQALKDDKDYQDKSQALDKAKADFEQATTQLASERKQLEQQRESEAKSHQQSSSSARSGRGG